MKLLGALFQSLRVTAESIDAWTLTLRDVPLNVCIATLEAGVRTGKLRGEFAPGPIQFREMIFASAEQEDPASVFAAGPRAERLSETAKLAWQRYGGWSRYGMLPDVRSAADSDRALASWRFEQARFVELWNAVVESRRTEQFVLTKQEARAALEVISKALPGAKQVTKLLEVRDIEEAA